jgi:predicted transcriptional regulator
MGPGKPLSAPVAEAMTPNPISVHPKDSIATAIRRMEEGGYRHLPVVVNEKPVGILSVKRIVHYLVEHFPATVYNLPPNGLTRLPRREGA